LYYFTNNESVFKLLRSGGLWYKPLGFSRGTPWLHFVYSLVHLFVCGDRNK